MFSRHLLIACFIFLSLTLQTNAQYVSPEEALDVAQSFLKVKNSINRNTLLYSGSIPDENQLPALHIFSLSPRGFVITSADKAAFPVVGYSTGSQWPDNELPENVSVWLANYTSQITAIRSAKIQPDQEIRQAWNDPDSFFGNATKTNSQIPPLILSRWNQGTFYNDSCPVINGVRTLAGCVPVALAQVICFHRYPARGTGFKEYNLNGYGTITANFGITTYDYNGMLAKPDRFSPSLAQLIFHCGVSVNADYSVNGTSAGTPETAVALQQFFGYADEISYHNKSEYSDSVWKSMICDNLSQKQPLIYKGSQGGFSGHAWVCDGCDGTEYFHFNWGWSGFADGYYYLENLNPGNYDLTFGQGAVFNIHPENPPVFHDADTIKTASGTLCNAYWPFSDSALCSYTRLILPPQTSYNYIQLKPELVNLSTGDSIFIYSDDSLIAVFTAENPPVTIHLESHSALIRSAGHSDNNHWAFSYLSHNGSFCGNNAVYHALNGFLYDGSGNFDLNPGTDCRWLISPENEILDSISSIQIDFYRFDLSASDTVFIYEGQTTDSPLLAVIPGDQLPGPMQSAGNQLLVRLVTDSLSFSSDGLEIVYYSVLPEYCHELETITSFSGSIENGSNGYNYHNNTHCQWLLEPENNTGFTFTFSKLNTEPNYDRLEFYSAWSYPEQLLKVVSGNEIPEPFTIEGARVKVVFRTDDSVVFKGWEFSFQGKPLALDEISESTLRIYPVPAGNVLHVDLPVSFCPGSYTIRSSTGCLIRQQKIESDNQLNINISELSPGMYCLSVTGKTQTRILRFIRE